MNEQIARTIRRIGVLSATAAFAAVIGHGTLASSASGSTHANAATASPSTCVASHTIKGGLGWDGLCRNAA